VELLELLEHVLEQLLEQPLVELLEHVLEQLLEQPLVELLEHELEQPLEQPLVELLEHVLEQLLEQPLVEQPLVKQLEGLWTFHTLVQSFDKLFQIIRIINLSKKKQD
jgi:hypothetical protein